MFLDELSIPLPFFGAEGSLMFGCAKIIWAERIPTTNTKDAFFMNVQISISYYMGYHHKFAVSIFLNAKTNTFRLIIIEELKQ